MASDADSGQLRNQLEQQLKDKKKQKKRDQRQNTIIRKVFEGGARVGEFKIQQDKKQLQNLKNRLKGSTNSQQLKKILKLFGNKALEKMKKKRNQQFQDEELEEEFQIDQWQKQIKNSMQDQEIQFQVQQIKQLISQQLSYFQKNGEENPTRMWKELIQEEKIGEAIKNMFYHSQNQFKTIDQDLAKKIEKNYPKNYVPGQFSKFARKREQEIDQKQRFIQYVVKQAVTSYQLKLKQNAQALEKMSTQFQAKDDDLKDFFLSESQMKKFIQNQLKFSIQEAYQQNYFTIEKTLSTFVYRKITARRTAMIDGKFIQLSQIKIQDRISKNDKIFIPIAQSDLYIKLENNKAPTKVLFRFGQFLEENNIKFLNQQAKQQIGAMVTQYLRQKGIVLTKKQVQDLKPAIELKIKQQI